MKKFYLFISLILLTFISFIVIINIPKNYDLEYKVNNITIKEKYIKEEQGYQYNFIYNEINYPIFIKHKFIKKRKLIKDININSLEKEVCLNFAFDKTYNLCSQNDSLVSVNVLSKSYLDKYNISLKDNSKINTYEKIDIYDNTLNYYLWNYKGFINIGKENNDLKIFKTDNYDNPLTYENGKYLVFPDYDSKYYFRKVYIYNVENKKLESKEFNYDISYETYYLGEVENKLYFIDKKNKNEFSLDLEELKYELVGNSKKGFQIYNGQNFEKATVNKVIANETKFYFHPFPILYTLEDKTLYQVVDNKKIKVSNLKVDKIIKTSEDTVYYLVNDTLYKYNNETSETKLLTNKDWSFNNNNRIFIFN